MRSPILIRRVKGRSMLPTLRENQIILATGWFRKLKVNDIVIASHNSLEKIKRIQKINGDKVYLIGDNPDESTDSRQFGLVDKKNIIAVKLY